MKFIVERLPDCRASMRVDVPAETVTIERKRIVASFSQQAKIPGFRPGKVPSKVIEKRYGPQIEDELKQTLIRQGCQQGIKKEKIDVLNVTDVKDAEFVIEDGSFGFTAQLQTAPEFEVPNYFEIPVEVPKIEATDHDIDHQLDHLRERLATMEEVDKELELGDFAVLDYDGTLDGKPLAEIEEKAAQWGKAEGQWLRIDEAAFLPGFCEQLLGLKKDDTKEFEVVLPEEIPFEDLRGETLSYKVVVKGVSRRVMPEWTDELAGQIEEGATVETLREMAGKQIAAHQEQERVSEMTTQIMEYLDKELEFELPESAVMNETQRQVNDMVTRGHSQGLTEEQIKEQQEDIFKHASMQAQVNVKTGFILDQIAEKEGIEATQDEILGSIAQAAMQAGQTPKKFFKQVQKANQIGSFANQIVTSKTLELLREKATVTEVDRPAHECDNPDHQHDTGEDHDLDEEPAETKED
ncbi:MAG: trigger factor [Verrucomicrobiales bacterium]|jgi:trigger factor